MESNAGKILLSLVAATALVLALIGSAAATPNCNSEDDGACCDVGGESVPADVVCTNLVDAAPEAFCGAYCESDAEARALAICGDAVAVNDLTQIAFNVAVTKQHCRQTQTQNQVNSQHLNTNLRATQTTQLSCNETSVTCGDASQACTQAVSVECPACPSTVVQDTIIRCKSVKVMKSGVIRKRGCVSFLEASTAVCE
jgi:hypothetical protein